MRMIAEAALGAAGFAVETAEDVPAARAALETFRPDIVLLDVDLPGVDGITFCRQLHGDPKTREIPVCMMTGLNDLASIQQAYEAGATDFVIKPPNWVILAQRLRYIRRASLAARQLAEANRDLTLAGVVFEHIPEGVVITDRDARHHQREPGVHGHQRLHGGGSRRPQGEPAQVRPPPGGFLSRHVAGSHHRRFLARRGLEPPQVRGAVPRAPRDLLAPRRHGGGEPLHRHPAGHQLREGERGAHPLPRLPRCAHRAAEPTALPRPHGAGDQPRQARQGQVRAGLPRPGRVQEGQRHPRPRNRGRASRRGRQAPAPAHPRRGHGGAARRGRVPDPPLPRPRRAGGADGDRKGPPGAGRALHGAGERDRDHGQHGRERLPERRRELR